MKPLLLRDRRRIVTAALVVAVAIAAVTGGWAAAQVAEPWPSFVMTWRETGVGLGPNGAPGTQLFRLEYTNRRQFRTTLLENPSVPSAVGSTWTFDGRASTFRDARHGKEVVQPFNPDEFTVPDEWLAPGKIAFLLEQPGTRPLPGVNGLAALQREEVLPNGKRVREEVTYRPTDGIPTRRIISVDGVEVSRKEMVDFRLGKP